MLRRLVGDPNYLAGIALYLVGMGLILGAVGLVFPKYNLLPSAFTIIIAVVNGFKNMKWLCMRWRAIAVVDGLLAIAFCVIVIAVW
jgi:hypothetical protein